jgi:hypothetical protein
MDSTLPNLFVTGAGFAQIPENILRQLGADVRGALVQLPSEPEPQIELEDETTLVFHDEWGIKWAKPQSSFYMDPVGAPLRGELTADRLASYPWPDPAQEGRYVGLREEVERLRNTDPEDPTGELDMREARTVEVTYLPVRVSTRTSMEDRRAKR